MCLDGLSIERYAYFCIKLLDLPLSFTEELKQPVEFLKSFSRDEELSGLLKNSFQIIQLSCNLYGGLLRSAQKCLDWKKMTPTKVPDNHRLHFCSLDMLVHEDL